MSNLVVGKVQLSAHELALINNDLSKLTKEERSVFYNQTCESLGLNPLTQPFGYIEFRGGKLSLYAKKDCTDQLRKIHGVSIEISSKETINDNFVVMAKAKDASGRYDEDMGSVSIKGLSGENLGNAMMKAITKAKRRVTLSICGLGILDESEAETVRDARIVNENKLPPAEEPKKETTEQQFESKTQPEQPVEKPIVNHAPASKVNCEDYRLRFAFGNFKKGLSFAEIGIKDLNSLRTQVMGWALKIDESGKPVPEQILEFIELSENYMEKHR
jgi:hypothetical protein